MKVSTKLILLVGTALVGVVLIAATTLSQLKQSLVESRQQEITNLLLKAEHLVLYYQQQEAQGKLTREAAQSAAKAAISELNADSKSYFWITSTDSINLVHPNPSLIGTKTGGNRTTMGDLTDTQAYAQGLQREHVALVDVLIHRSANSPLEPKLQGVVAVPAWQWWIGTGFFYDDINAAFWRVARTMIAIAVLIFAVVGTMAWLMTRSIRRALGGEPADAAALAAQIAAGNLTTPIALAAGDRSSLMHALHEMRVKLRDLVQGIQQSSDSIATGSSEIAQGNADLSQRTEEQAASLEETAASMEQLTATVKQNAENARQARQLAVLASDATGRGGSAVDEVIETMQRIAGESKRIGEIIGTIEGIAFQTNILALNAAVEAARAGDEGRGFAVVAGEVRALAQRSAAAAKDIRALIGSSVERVDAGSGQVAVAGERMKEIVQSIMRVSDIMGEIEAASVEQSTGIEQVNQAVSQMDTVTQQNAALVEQAAAAAAALDEQAARLRSTVGVFRVAG
ncbi:methyl-accepting chemotaxis protein [Paraburkholderia tropica]|uniref:methyl-accepting chemotaxis protein n=1 Tax=Paraburkholderia tropica TaxID=92647 RepID=UPI000F530597|nr:MULTISPECIES: methyl-accepting chemotaxis protein [Paraburkholderia]MBB3002728.1 methyl-accepting chemotaxis protein [Paraburkholderia tropica]MBB6321915.1 methyl-accepting chemotaxis protein [Paraburkholderia tropica]QNB16384.1 chemotaxis protein [Paraburkholderia tropica]RQM46689.1 chemotaxis protein [Paraburkholderia bannensis]